MSAGGRRRRRAAAAPDAGSARRGFRARAAGSPIRSRSAGSTPRVMKRRSSRRSSSSTPIAAYRALVSSQATRSNSSRTASTSSWATSPRPASSRAARRALSSVPTPTAEIQASVETRSRSAVHCGGRCASGCRCWGHDRPRPRDRCQPARRDARDRDAIEPALRRGVEVQVRPAEDLEASTARRPCSAAPSTPATGWIRPASLSSFTRRTVRPSAWLFSTGRSGPPAKLKPEGDPSTSPACWRNRAPPSTGCSPAGSTARSSLRREGDRGRVPGPGWRLPRLGRDRRLRRGYRGSAHRDLTAAG